MSILEAPLRDLVPRAVEQLAAAANRKPYAACVIGLAVTGFAAVAYLEDHAPGTRRWRGFAAYVRGMAEAFASAEMAEFAAGDPEEGLPARGTHLRVVKE